METQGITTEKAPRLAPQGLKSVGTSTDGQNCTASGEGCQEITPAAVAAWFTTHHDRFIPTRAKGFSYKREESAWIIQKNTATALADIIAKGAVYRTTCGSQTEPLAADEENKDRKNLAALRYGHFTWDFDAPGDVEKARNAAVTLVHELLPPLGVQPSQVYVWLSGSKGFHVDIPDVCIGSEAGDRLLPLIYQRMAAEIAGEKIPYDTSMYCMGKGKQYRLPNVKRSNGLHKIALTADELKSMSIEDMQELAKKPRLLPLAPLTKTPDDAPIREMYQRHKEGVWHDELKPKRPPLTLDDKERFAGKQFACMKYMAEEQEGYAGVAAANVNAYCAMLIAPEQEFFKRDTEDTEDIYGDCIMRCSESGSYPTPEDRLDKLRAEIRIKNIRPWSCGAAHKYLPKEALKCGDCIYKQLEAESAFAGSQVDASVFDESEWEDRRQRSMRADALVDDGTWSAANEGSEDEDLNHAKLIEKINRNHAFTLVMGKPYIIRENVLVDSYSEPLTTMTERGFVTKYGNMYVTVKDGDKVDREGNPKTKTKGVGAFWLGHPKRRTVEGIGFYPKPRKAPANHINLYRGASLKATETPQPDRCAKYLNFIWETICNGDEAVYKYVLAWIADLVQKPGGRKPGVCLVLRGGQGTGKGTFAEYLAKMFSPYSIVLDRPDQLVGRFNGHMSNKLFVVADEAFWAGDRSKVGPLKSFITESKLPFEWKGRDVEMIDSYHRIVMLSNESWVVPADVDDRRFAVLDVSPEHAKDNEYFGAIRRDMDNGGLEAFYRMMLDHDYSDVVLWSAPKTQGLLDQKLESLDDVGSFVLNMLMDGNMPLQSGIETDTPWPKWIHKDRLYDSFVGSLPSGRDRFRLKPETFSKRLRKYIPGVNPEFKPPVDAQGRRPRVFGFPPLHKARMEFEAVIGQSMRWPE